MWIEEKFSAFTDYLTLGRREELAATVFTKALFAIVLVSLVKSWMISEIVLANYRQNTPRSFIGKIIFFPSMLAEENITIFFTGSLIFLILAMAMKPHYVVNMLFFWLVLNFFRIQFPVVNGSDYVLVSLSILAMPLALGPMPRGNVFNAASSTLFNTFRLLVQIQIIAIYVISGIDKIASPVWRSGEAFDYIAHIDVMFNPLLRPLLEHAGAQLAMSWLTISFELGFGLLVYFDRTRVAAVCAGTAFHIVIWLMLGLPDFAWTMIATYPIFLKDAELRAFTRKFRRSPP